MTDKSDKTAGRSGSARQDRSPRQDRLKSALRENLKRRKLQARERGKSGDPTDDPSHQDDATPHEGTAGTTGGEIE